MASATNAMSPTNITYFDRCVEELNPSKVSTLENQSLGWRVLAGVTFVAFTALAVGAFVATAVYFPVYVPIAGISAMLFAIPVANYVNNFFDYSERATEQARDYRRLQQCYNEIGSKNAEEIQALLEEKGISKSLEEIPSQLPILAKAIHLDIKKEEQFKTKEQLKKEAHDLEAKDAAAHRREIYDLRNCALFSEQRALQLKVEAAFVDAVLHKGNFGGGLEDVVSISQSLYQERMLGSALEDDEVTSRYVTFKNRDITPLTYDQVKGLSIDALAKYFIAAMF